jgi:hypothetical protein
MQYMILVLIIYYSKNRCCTISKQCDNHPDQWCSYDKCDLVILCLLYYAYLYPQLQYDPYSHVCLIDNNSNTSIIIYVTVKDAILPFTIIIGIYVRLYIRRLRRESAILLTTKRDNGYNRTKKQNKNVVYILK